MPKIVDHEVRRREIAEAVLRVTARRGLEAVSLRDVAAEANVSMGMVQHYFTSKDRMLVFACRYMIERTNQRIAEHLDGPSQPATGREVLRNLLVELLPLDAERRAGTRVWMAFLARAVIEPDLAAFMRETWINSHRTITKLIATSQQRGEIGPDRDPRHEAAAGLAVADGLVSHVYIGDYSAETAIGIIDDYLDRLFGSA